MPAEPDTPWALQPPAITKPFTRELSPTMNRPSGVNVGQPLNTLRTPSCSTCGISGASCSANQPSTSQSGSIGGGSSSSANSRGSVDSALRLPTAAEQRIDFRPQVERRIGNADHRQRRLAARRRAR